MSEYWKQTDLNTDEIAVGDLDSIETSSLLQFWQTSCQTAGHTMSSEFFYIVEADQVLEL